jgi:hypothetical protein
MAVDRLLYLVVCGAGPAERAGAAVTQAEAAGWEVQVITTPAGLGFIDPDTLEARTGDTLLDVFPWHHGLQNLTDRAVPDSLKQ